MASCGCEGSITINDGTTTILNPASDYAVADNGDGSATISHTNGDGVLVSHTVCAQCATAAAAAVAGTDTFGNNFLVGDIVLTLSNGDLLTTAVPAIIVNSGTTAAAGDGANGSGAVFPGDTIHFWSSDGSVNVDVVAGSAIVDITAQGIVDIDCYEIPGGPSPIALNDGTEDNEIAITSFGMVWTNNTGSSVDVAGIQVTARTTGLGISGFQMHENTLGAGNASAFTPVTTAFADYVHLFAAPATVPAGGTVLFSAIGSTDIVFAESAGSFESSFNPPGTLAEVLSSASTTQVNVVTATDGSQKAWDLSTGTPIEIDITGGIPVDWTECPVAQPTDPASAEPGNLIIEGDDGEEYALPLMEELCLIETLTPVPLAGLDSSDPNDDLSIDDLFPDVVNNTGADQSLGGLQFTTDGAWPATDRVVTARLGSGTIVGTVTVPGGTGDGVAFIIPFSPFMPIAASETITFALSTDNFSGGQGVSTTTALVGDSVRHEVRTYSDGETTRSIEFVNGQPVVLDPIPAEWVVCPVFDDDETAAIKQCITDLEPAETYLIECFAEGTGINQRAVDGTDEVPEALPVSVSIPSAAVGTGINGLFDVQLNEIGSTFTLATITMVTFADGVVVDTRTRSHNFGGASKRLQFGAVNFVSGVNYELRFSSDIPGMEMHATTVPLNNGGIVFTSPTDPAAGAIPQIRIVTPGDDRFTVVHTADGVETAYDSDGDVFTGSRTNWVECPLNNTEVSEVESAITEALEDILICDLAEGSASEPLTGASGTLADGTTWTRTVAGGAVIDGIGGDTRWETTSELTYTFSQPVNFAATPTTDPALGNPIVWTYENQPPPNTTFGPHTRLVSDGDPVEYVVGSEFDLDLFLNVFGPSQANANIENSASAALAQDDWGIVTAPNATVISVQGRDNEAMNFAATPTQIVNVCEALDQLVNAEPETCPPVGVTNAIDAVSTAGPTPGTPGTPVAPLETIQLATGTGTTNETVIPFHGRLPGETFDVRFIVTRINAGGGGFSLGTSGVFSNSSGGSDYLIRMVLPEGLNFRWMLNPASAGGSEAFRFFDTSPVTGYAQGAGAPALTLPFFGTWTNGNNGAQSGMSFDAANEITFRSDGVAGAGSSVRISLMDVPTLVEEETCDRTESLLELMESFRAAEGHYRSTEAGAQGSVLLWDDRFEARNVGRVEISPSGSSVGVQPGFWEVIITADTEAPLAGDSTRLQIALEGVPVAFIQVDGDTQTTGVWSHTFEATSQTLISVTRDTVVGSGNVDVEMHVRELV